MTVVDRVERAAEDAEASRIRRHALCRRPPRGRQLPPHRFEELRYTLARCARDPEEAQLERVCALFERCDRWVAVRTGGVDLVRGDDLRLGRQFGLKEF